jgi:hypothetical protein
MYGGIAKNVTISLATSGAFLLVTDVNRIPEHLEILRKVMSSIPG